MPSVNLIPPEMLHQRRRRKRARQWLIGVCAAYVLALVPWVREQRAASHLADAYAVMDALDHSLSAMRAAATGSSARLQALEAEWARAQKLLAKRAWSGLLAQLIDALPNDVWLDAVATNPSTPPPPPPDGSAGLIGHDGPRRIVMSGHATQIEALFAFERRLRDIDAFVDVRLTTVEEASVNDVQVDTLFRGVCVVRKVLPHLILFQDYIGGTALMGAVAMVLWFSHLKPDTARAELHDLRVREADLQVLHSRLQCERNNNESEYDALEEQLESTGILSSRAPIEARLAEIRVMARRFKLDKLQIMPFGRQRDGEVLQASFVMSAESSFRNIVSMLGAFEGSERWSDISHVRLSVVKGLEDEERVRVSLTLHFYALDVGSAERKP